MRMKEEREAAHAEEGRICQAEKRGESQWTSKEKKMPFLSTPPPSASRRHEPKKHFAQTLSCALPPPQSSSHIASSEVGGGAEKRKGLLPPPPRRIQQTKITNKVLLPPPPPPPTFDFFAPFNITRHGLILSFSGRQVRVARQYISLSASTYVRTYVRTPTFLPWAPMQTHAVFSVIKSRGWVGGGSSARDDLTKAQRVFS